MEIDEATTYTLSALTFDEKTIARGLVRSEQFRKESGSVWLRAPSIDLIRDLAYVRSEARRQNFQARNFRFYCDTLIVKEGASITPETTDDNKIIDFSFQIFARKIEANSVLDVALAVDCELAIMTPNIKDTVTLLFTLPGGKTTTISPVVPENKFGVEFSLESSNQELKVDYRPTPSAGLELTNYLDLINEDGTLQERDYRNDDYPRLLQFQLLVAQANVSVKSSLSIDLLQFVVAATNTKFGGYINLQANTLLSNLLIAQEVVSVPSVNIYSSKMILKSRLVAAQAFEDSFRHFQSSSGDSNIRAILAFNMLAKNKDVIHAYEFQKELKQKDFKNAVQANAEASKALENSNVGLDQLGKDFQAGIDQWVRKKKEEAAKEIVGKLFQAGLAIGATVMTGGTAAPLAGVAIGNLAGAASSIAKIVKALKEFYDKVKGLIEKLKPVIDKIKELVKIVMAVIEALKNFNSATGDATTIRPKIDGKDPINATAEYDRFSIFVANLESQMADYKDIKGKQEYFTALKIMVINGKAAIQVQANLVQKGDELAIIIVQKQVEDRDEKRLTAAATATINSKAVTELLSRAMFDRVLAIRGRVYLDFFTYLTAYHYHTLRDDRLITMSPVKPVADYQEDMTSLQGAVASYGSEVLIQKRSFSFVSLCDYNTPQDLALALQSSTGATFTVSPNDAIWTGFWRIRMGRVRCFLEGLKISTTTTNTISPPPPQNLRLTLSTNGRFFDHQSQTPSPRSFIADKRRLIFEYNITTGEILCDGVYGQEQDYTMHTPMTSWLIKIDDRGTDTVILADLDFFCFDGY